MSSYHFQLGQMDEARALVMAHHYSQRKPSVVVVCGSWHESGGLFGDSGPMVAACMFSHPPTRWSEEVIELIRLVRTPECDAPLSGLVSETTRWVRRLKVCDLVVSFADATVGHHGGIYQAASWIYHGQRERRMDGVVIGGKFVPGRMANDAYGTQSPAKLNERGIDAVPHYDDGKHLYWRALNRSGRQKAKRLGLLSMPYPKPDAEAIAS